MWLILHHAGVSMHLFCSKTRNNAQLFLLCEVKMKIFIKLLTIIFLVAGFPLLGFTISAEEAKPSKEMLEQQNALNAYNDLYEMFMLNGVPNNYAGEYIDGSHLVILISNDDQTPYRDILEKHDCIQFKRTKLSYKELQELFDKAVNMFTSNEKGNKLCEEAHINVINNSVDIEINAIEYIKLPKEERDKFFIDGVNYKYVNSSYALNSIIIAEKNGACGWNELDGERYYIKSDGTFATKSTNIDGIRYKFSSKGIYLGKYSGWTKSAKGKRYWKDGKLVKNDWIKTPNGKLYYAGEKGYMVQPPK